VTEQPPAAEPRQFTPEELEAAKAQLAAQAAAAPEPLSVPESDLGVSMLASGAEADEVNPAELLASIRHMQARIDKLESEKRLETAPELVKYATAISDHLATKAAQNPAIDADPDHSYGPARDLAAELVSAAKDATTSGNTAEVGPVLGKVVSWVTRHARRHPHVDYSYVLELAEEAEQAAAKLAA
jgi:hypothetical protein